MCSSRRPRPVSRHERGAHCGLGGLRSGGGRGRRDGAVRLPYASTPVVVVMAPPTRLQGWHGRPSQGSGVWGGERGAQPPPGMRGEGRGCCPACGSMATPRVAASPHGRPPGDIMWIPNDIVSFLVNPIEQADCKILDQAPLIPQGGVSMASDEHSR